MTVACTKCKERHEIEHLEEDGIFESPVAEMQIPAVVSEMTYTAHGFTYLAPRGLEAASRGDVIIVRCPGCATSEHMSGSHDNEDLIV